MSEPSHLQCPECGFPLNISILSSTQNEDLILECSYCGYTAFTADDLPLKLRKNLETIFEHAQKIGPLSLIKTFRNPRASLGDKFIASVAKLGSTIIDYKTLIGLIAFFAATLGRKRLGMLIGSAVAACMILYRDVVRERIGKDTDEALEFEPAEDEAI